MSLDPLPSAPGTRCHVDAPMSRACGAAGRGRPRAGRAGLGIAWVAVVLAIAGVGGPVMAARATAPASAATSAAVSRGQWIWRRVPLPAGTTPVLALAVRGDGDRVAVGGPIGVVERRVDARCERRAGPGAPAPSCDAAATDAEATRRWPIPGPVLDLDYAKDGALWVASQQGLWRIDAQGRATPRSPATGDEARSVLRVRAAPGLVVAGTGAGAFVSPDGEHWTALDAEVPVGPVEALDVETDARGPGRHRIWLAVGERLYRSDFDGAAHVATSQVLIPGRPTGAPPVEIRAGGVAPGVVVLYPGGFARSLDPADARRWQVDYPVLLPGATTTRLSRAAGVLWLGTDRGLLRADDLSGPWQRAGNPAGSSRAGSVVAVPGGVLAVSGEGLLAGTFIATPLSARGTAGPDAAWPRPQDQPALAQVHARALAYAGLEPEYFARLTRGLGRRGWLPAMSLRAGAAYDRDTHAGVDQSFTYGVLNDLRDQGGARSRDFEGSVTLTWDLRDLAYPTDAPELSREARQVIGLRDNLLDEVNQLYFDRRRALLAWAGFADRSDPEAVALEIRCAELAAGLDAWTGGWFSAQLDGSAALR